MPASRTEDIDTFYRLIAALIRKHPARRLGELTKRDGLPARGVYFFFEPDELRSKGAPRVVRVGTHGLTTGSSSTLWGRLVQHRGTLTPKGGNHRGSIFRLLLGAAMHHDIASWGRGATADAQTRDAERVLEERVSDYIGRMFVAWLDVPDAAGPESLRGVVERNAIALLSNYDRSPIDPASSNWIGHQSDRERVRKSGLWNNNHVTETYDPGFLQIMADLIDAPTETHPTASHDAVYVIQCAKSKKPDGWITDDRGRTVHFVAKPELAPPEPHKRYVHPDDLSDDGRTWRQHIVAYNRHHAATGQNPLGLHRSADLYANPVYGALANAIAPDRLYVLSACWGLIRSDFLIPNYDVTFSQAANVPAYAVRDGDEGWNDLDMLAPVDRGELVFVGGQRYLATFARLSQGYGGKRVSYFNSAHAADLTGIEMRRYDTVTKTNWHYELARDVVNGRLRVAATVTPRSPRPAPTKLGAGGKYAPLHDHLRGLSASQHSVTLTFAEIETILSSALPQSAIKHVGVWWSNGHHAQSNAWIDAGFHKSGHHIGPTKETSWIRFDRMD